MDRRATMTETPANEHNGHKQSRSGLNDDDDGNHDDDGTRTHREESAEYRREGMGQEDGV